MEALGAVGAAVAAVGKPPGVGGRRHRSLPFSPLDVVVGGQQRRLPLTPLPHNACNTRGGAAGGQQVLKAAQLGADLSELVSMDVWSMRQLIRTAGLKHADCEDIDALRERARQALAGEPQLEPKAAAEAEERKHEHTHEHDGSGGNAGDDGDDDAPELPPCLDENGSLELRRTSMRSSMDGLQPAGHRRARVSAPNATPCIRHCEHISDESSSDNDDDDDDAYAAAGAEQVERAPKRARVSPEHALDEAPPAPAASNDKAEAEADTLAHSRLLEATVSAARFHHDPAVTASVLSPRMLYRLTCCAEEIQLEVECSAEDVDWAVAVDAKAATATLFNAVYLSEFIPAWIVDRLSWNVGLVHQFVQGYVQCFQAILYLLKQQCVTPPANAPPSTSLDLL
jgi:hypothetical protein